MPTPMNRQRSTVIRRRRFRRFRWTWWMTWTWWILAPKPCQHLLLQAIDALRVGNQELRALPNVGGKSQRLSGGGREVYPYKNGAGGKLTVLFVRHLVRKTDGFLFYFQYRGTNADEVAGMQLALVFNVLLHGGHTCAFAQEAGSRQAHVGKEVPCRFIELAHVPHHIHVAHMIAVPGINSPAVSKDRLRHGGTLPFRKRDQFGKKGADCTCEFNP